jgi:hypothetical protein
MTAVFRSGKTETTKIGYENSNHQQCHGTVGVKGSDYLQYAYLLQCLDCGYIYGASGTDVAERKCPQCQRGEPGIRYWL